MLLGIDIEIPPAEMVKKLSHRIKDLKDEIENLEASIPWIWGESFGILEIRVKLISTLLGKKIKDESEREKIAEIISIIESES